jgi:hypothetical protein
MRTGRFWLASLGLLLTGWAPPPVALAAEADELADIERVADADLAEARGGFTVAGVEVRLGAEIRTYLDGELVLQTNVSWDDTVTSTTIASAALTQAGAAELQAGILRSGGITMRVGDESVFLANNGHTALLHRTENGLQNVLVNTASGVGITQEMDVTIDLGDFDDFQQDVIDTRLADALSDVMSLATAGSLGN